ncbi:uncharacterized protein [Nicotiana sylvestris]|uniref:uncharacterized protein n=1 Tax=Nicotiana sylvestris TaxID=4096 RepID=UPI00388CE32A
MVEGSRQWHEKLLFALLGYRTTVQTSVGVTPYLLVYGTEALSLIDEKRLAAIYHGQLYQKRMARAYNKKVEAKGKFAPNWQGLFVVTRVLSNGVLYLTDVEGKCVEIAINFDAVKRYYV